MDGMDAANGSQFFTIFHALVLTRWIHFASVFVLFGSAFFWFYMENGFPATRRATEKLLRAASPVAAVTGVGWLSEIFANMAGGFEKLADSEAQRLFFMETQFGPVALLRLLLLLAAVIVAVLPWRNKAWLSAQLHIGAFLLIDQAWLGHAAEGGAGLWGALMITVYCIHVIAAAAWVGGLPPLFLALRELGNRGADVMVATLLRYSVMAMIAVGLIVATGLGNAGFRVGFSPTGVVWGDYGFALAVKASLVASMLALAFFNRFIAMPRLRAASDGVATQTARLRASVAFELFLGVLVLGAAAVLGVTPPPQ